MFRLTLAVVTGLLAATTALPARAADCGPTVHEISIVYRGFLPEKQYICSGQRVVFKNRTGAYAKFDYKRSNGEWVNTGWIRAGDTFEPGPYGAINYANQFKNLYVNYRYPPSTRDGTVVVGTAPDKY